MSLYDGYVADFWRANPKGKESHDSVVLDKGFDFHDKHNAEREMKRVNTTAKCLTAYGTEVYASPNGQIVEFRLDDSHGRFTAAFFPSEQTWREFEKPMSYTTWATR